MMLTAIACQEKDITFASVHDSYWTHACDIDEMSHILRNSFIQLHSQDIMDRLRAELLERFSSHRNMISHEIPKGKLEAYKAVAKRIGYRFRGRLRITLWEPFHLPPVPKKGTFDINQVANSKYFFH